MGLEDGVSRLRDADPTGAEAAGSPEVTAEEVNALPERVRQYIHFLETDCDSAGTIRENWCLREENAALRQKLAGAHQQEIAPGCPVCGWNDEHSPQCRYAGTAAPASSDRVLAPLPISAKDLDPRVDKGVNRHRQDLPHRPIGDK